MITRSTSSSRNESRKPVGLAEEGEMPDVLPPHFRICIDEADQVDAVFGMLEQLAGDQLPDVSSANDDRVLEVRDVPPLIARAPTRSIDTNAIASAQNTTSFGMVGWRRPVSRVEDVEGPDGHRDHVEDAGEVVDRRVVGALFVLVVEAVQLRDEHPRRDGGDERDDLVRRVEHTGRARAGDEPFREQQRGEQADDVGGDEHATDEPSAPADNRRTPPLLDDLERAVVEHRDRAVVQRQTVEESRLLHRVHRAAPSAALTARPGITRRPVRDPA